MKRILTLCTILLLAATAQAQVLQVDPAPVDVDAATLIGRCTIDKAAPEPVAGREVPKVPCTPTEAVAWAKGHMNKANKSAAASWEELHRQATVKLTDREAAREFRRMDFVKRCQEASEEAKRKMGCPA